MKQVISAEAVQALKDALSTIYWYKSDLRSFLSNCMSESTIISRVDWNNYKRQIVSDIIDILCNNQDKYLGDIRRLLYEVSNMKSFKHLEFLEDGEKKAERARNSVKALKKIVDEHDRRIEKEKEIAEKRKEYMEKLRSNKAVLKKLDQIKEDYFRLVSTTSHQKRGYELEKILYDIFELFDLDPKASFRNIGEQIDGAFTLDGTDFLFEAKWQEYKTNASDLDAFVGKISRKLDNTLGLFLSINGFSEDAVKIHSRGRSTIILMDGTDLMVVLEGRIDFVTLLVRKRRHAAQTGNIYYNILKDLQ